MFKLGLSFDWFVLGLINLKDEKLLLPLLDWAWGENMFEILGLYVPETFKLDWFEG